MLQLLLERRVIAGCGAALDAAGRGDRPRFRQQRLGQGGLACPSLTDERNRPDGLDGMGHGLAPPPLPDERSYSAGRSTWEYAGGSIRPERSRAGIAAGRSG